MDTTRLHPETGATLTRDVRPQTVTVGALSETVDVPGWYPQDAGDSIHLGSDLAASDEVVARLRAAQPDLFPSHAPQGSRRTEQG